MLLAIIGSAALLAVSAAGTGLGGYFLNKVISKENAERSKAVVDYEYEKLGRRQITTSDLFEELKK